VKFISGREVLLKHHPLFPLSALVIPMALGFVRPWRLVMPHLLRERYPEISFKVLNAGVDGDTLFGFVHLGG